MGLQRPLLFCLAVVGMSSLWVVLINKRRLSRLGLSWIQPSPQPNKPCLGRAVLTTGGVPHSSPIRASQLSLPGNAKLRLIWKIIFVTIFKHLTPLSAAILKRTLQVLLIPSFILSHVIISPLAIKLF